MYDMSYVSQYYKACEIKSERKRMNCTNGGSKVKLLYTVASLGLCAVSLLYNKTKML